MKKILNHLSASSNQRALLALSLSLAAFFLALLALVLYPSDSARAQGTSQHQNDVSKPEVVRIAGPVSQDQDLRVLPYRPARAEHEERRLTRHPQIQSTGKTDPELAPTQSDQASAMPTPIATFDGMNSSQSGCGCLPPDTDGDVGPSHYIQSVNSSIKIFNKSGTALNGPNGTTYNSFFSALGPATPCGNGMNDGDGFVFYDQLADRWVVSDFAFVGIPGPPPFYQCIGVSKTGDPVAGGWWLYALQVDPSNPTWVGDYPKLALWPDAYYLSVNLFDAGIPTTPFEGVRVYAFPRSQLINGTGSPNPTAVAFTILPAGLGDSYSLVPATFRAGSPPPAGRPEYFLAVDSPATADVVLTQVKAWLFHVDFATPGNSTIGIGSDHTPDGIVTVNGFVDAFTSTTLIVPQSGTTAKLDTLGDKIMTPLVYQNLSGTESLWASHTVNNNQNGTGPTAIRWYQFDVSGGTIPATPVQQQTFNNGGDGLWRFMPSITVDASGNMAVGYSVSSSSTNPAINYAGRLAGDPLGSLAQGEALMIQGAGHQTSSSGRWGDYSYMSIDPVDNLTFWHTNEYYPATSSSSWFTRVGKFQFPSPPQLTRVVSRKTHTGVGDFDVTLFDAAQLCGPGTCPRQVECRSGGTNSDFTMIFTFSSSLSSCGSASTGTVVSGPGAGECSVNLSGVANATYITVTLNGVVSSAGGVGNNYTGTMGVLLGDVNGTGRVDAADVSSVRQQTLQSVTGSNFRNDLNTSGRIDAADVSIAREQTLTSLPTPP
jgi:hypothetical protein